MTADMHLGHSAELIWSNNFYIMINSSIVSSDSLLTNDSSTTSRNIWIFTIAKLNVSRLTRKIRRSIADQPKIPT